MFRRDLLSAHHCRDRDHQHKLNSYTVAEYPNKSTRFTELPIRNLHLN